MRTDAQAQREPAEPWPTVAVPLTAIRLKLGWSHAGCAQPFARSVGMVRDGEPSRARPDRATRVLLYVIAHTPAAVHAAGGERGAGGGAVVSARVPSMK